MSEPHGVRRSTVIVGGGAVAAAAWWVLCVGVPNVRESAHRANCQGRHKQFALGLINFESTAGRLPAGTYPAAGVDPDGRLSWVVASLPFIEEHRTFDRFDLAAPANSPRNVAAADTRVRMFVCFSSEGGSNFDGNAWKTRPPVTHTVAISGVGRGAASLPAGHPRAGLIGDDRGARLDAKEVPDGLANTLLLAEIGSAPGHWARGGWGTLRYFDPDARPHAGPGRTLGGVHVSERNWFAANSHSTIVAMADGSVRTLSQQTDPAVLEALATAAGGETQSGE